MLKFRCTSGGYQASPWQLTSDIQATVRVHSVAAAYSYLETSPQIRLLTVAFKRRPSFAKALAELEDVNIYICIFIYI